MLLALPFAGMGCSETENFFGEGDEGTLFLSVGVNDNAKVQTRALSAEDTTALLSNCRIRVYDNNGLIRKYEGIASLPTDGLILTSGNYSARVTAGDSVAASFSKRYFEGKENFTITKGAATSVKVDCKIQNTLVKVKFAESLSSVLNDYKLIVGTTKELSSALEFTTETTDSTGYYMLPSDSVCLYWKFMGTTANGSAFTRTDTIGSVKAATLYTLTCDFTPSSTETGGGMLKLDVNAEPIEENTSVVNIYQRPSITAMNASNEVFSIDSPTYMELNHSEELSLWIATSCVLEKAILECNNFESWGLPANSMDLTQLSKDEKSNLSELGLVIKNSFNLETYQGNMGIRFTESLIKKISSVEGEYTIKLDATDEKGNNRSVVWTIIASDATVITTAVEDTEVYSSTATITAQIAKEPEGTLTFQYRDAGVATRASEWITVAATREGNTISAQLTGLQPGHKYEYRVVDGDRASNVICSFTTETEAQPENAGFEYWSGSVPMYLYGSGQSMWWDSGNGGSKSASMDLTTHDTTYKHSGNYSAKLASAYANVFGLGKFAAGNAFVGKYIRTDGTNGVLGWGRPFTSRPKKLKGYVRYECGVVDYSCDSIAVGENDKGQIYIVLGDWEGQTDSKSGETWPVIIKTKTSEQQLFNPQDEAIIAYGQKTFTESTGGSGMIEFTIDLDYRSTRKPTSIIIVASASKYGDYFAGSTNSTMWIDDFELIY